MATIRVADKPTLDTVKSTVDSVKTAVNTVNTKVASLTNGPTLKKGSVTVAANATTTIPRTTNIADSFALIENTYVSYAGDYLGAMWRRDSGSVISISGVTDSAITIKGGSSAGGTLYYTYWE